MDCLHHALVGIACPMTLQQFDLYMVERIQVGKAVLDRARQQGILVEQCFSRCMLELQCELSSADATLLVDFIDCEYKLTTPRR